MRISDFVVNILFKVFVVLMVINVIGTVSFSVHSADKNAEGKDYVAEHTEVILYIDGVSQGEVEVDSTLFDFYNLQKIDEEDNVVYVKSPVYYKRRSVHPVIVP